MAKSKKRPNSPQIEKQTQSSAKSTNIAYVAGYCGMSSVLDHFLANWSEAYGEQTILDHANLVRTVKNDRTIQDLMDK
jgi:hypothetical protein